MPSLIHKQQLCTFYPNTPNKIYKRTPKALSTNASVPDPTNSNNNSNNNNTIFLRYNFGRSYINNQYKLSCKCVRNKAKERIGVKCVACVLVNVGVQCFLNADFLCVIGYYVDFVSNEKGGSGNESVKTKYVLLVKGNNGPLMTYVNKVLVLPFPLTSLSNSLNIDFSTQDNGGYTHCADLFNGCEIEFYQEGEVERFGFVFGLFDDNKVKKVDEVRVNDEDDDNINLKDGVDSLMINANHSNEDMNENLRKLDSKEKNDAEMIIDKVINGEDGPIDNILVGESQCCNVLIGLNEKGKEAEEGKEGENEIVVNNVDQVNENKSIPPISAAANANECDNIEVVATGIIGGARDCDSKEEEEKESEMDIDEVNEGCVNECSNKVEKSVETKTINDDLKSPEKKIVSQHRLPSSILSPSNNSQILLPQPISKSVIFNTSQVATPVQEKRQNQSQLSTPPPSNTSNTRSQSSSDEEKTQTTPFTGLTLTGNLPLTMPNYNDPLEFSVMSLDDNANADEKCMSGGGQGGGGGGGDDGDVPDSLFDNYDDDDDDDDGDVLNANNNDVINNKKKSTMRPFQYQIRSQSQTQTQFLQTVNCPQPSALNAKMPHSMYNQAVIKVKEYIQSLKMNEEGREK